MNGWLLRLRDVLVSFVRRCDAWLGGGVPGPLTECDRVREFLAFLDDRRVLYTPYFVEYPAHVVESVRQIEAEARAALAGATFGPAASQRIARVRAACGHFLRNPGIAPAGAAAPVRGDALFFAVLDFRASLAAEAAALAHDFALDLPADLALISPPAERSGRTS